MSAAKINKSSTILRWNISLGVEEGSGRGRWDWGGEARGRGHGGWVGTTDRANLRRLGRLD